MQIASTPTVVTYSPIREVPPVRPVSRDADGDGDGDGVGSDTVKAAKPPGVGAILDLTV